jgi:hypothetical protein
MFGESSPDKVKAFLFLPDKSDNPRWKEREREREERQRNVRELKKDFRKFRGINKAIVLTGLDYEKDL